MVEPTALGEELMATISALRRLVRRNLRPSFSEPPLRGAQVELLLAVEDRPGIGIAQAGRVLGLAANSVSTLVNQLTDLGMLVRETDPGDRRAARLWLAENAVRRLSAWRQARVEFVGGGLAALPVAQREALAGAVPALRALLAALDSEAG